MNRVICASCSLFGPWLAHGGLLVCIYLYYLKMYLLYMLFSDRTDRLAQRVTSLSSGERSNVQPSATVQ